MSNEAGLNEEIATLEWKRMQKNKAQIQAEEFKALPKLIYVTYIGKKQQFMHTGRSRSARANPFRFQKEIPIAISEPEDVKFFLNQNSGYFNIEIMTPSKIAERRAKVLEAKALAEKEKAEIIKKEEDEKAKAIANEITKLKAEAVVVAKEELKTEALAKEEAERKSVEEELERKKGEAIKAKKEAEKAEAELKKASDE